MQPLEALTSVLTTAAFHASGTGSIIESNAAFVQLMRCVPGDDWRMNVDNDNRALLDAFWDGLFTNTNDLHQPVGFLLHGSNDVYQIRAQAVTNDHGEFVSAVGVIVVEASTSKHRWGTDAVTGLPEHDAVLERFEELGAADRPFVAAVVLLDTEASQDELRLKEATRQILSTTRPNDMLASEADGRFLLCAAGVQTTEAALALAERMVSRLAESEITARVGLVLPNHDAVPATLVREAEAGAYASEVGGFGFAPIDDDAAAI
ncbi:MAG: hypothetical protein ACI81L_002365 [Verrucomicrobiales bacterium]|jgi:hypothetical protein